MTTLKRIWDYDQNKSIGIYHNTITGYRYATIDCEEVPLSFGISSYKMDHCDRIDFLISKGVVCTIIISTKSSFGSFDYQCMINGASCLQESMNLQYIIPKDSTCRHDQQISISNSISSARSNRHHHKESAIHRKLRQMKLQNPTKYSLDTSPVSHFEMMLNWLGISKMFNHVTDFKESVLYQPMLVPVAM